MIQRRTLNGWSVRWDESRAADARADGWWSDETIGEVSARIATHDPQRLIIADGIRQLDAATLRSEAERMAWSFLRRGLQPGDVVSFMLPNWHEAAIIYLAATLAGLVAHPIVPAMRDAEMSFMLNDTGSRMIFVPARFRGLDYPEMALRVATSLTRPPEVVSLRGTAIGATSYDELLAADPLELPVIDPDSVKMVMYTSGTTGRAKGVMHSHNSLYALARQVQQSWHIGPESRFFIPSPISHIGGSIYAFEIPLLFGAAAILQDQWDADQAVAIMEAQGCTHMAGATPFLEQLLAAAERAGTGLPDLELFVCGGASVPPSLIRRAAAYLDGCTVTRVFGSTEVPVVTVGAMGDGDGDRAADTDGRIGIAEVRVTDAAGLPVQEGEVRVRAPQMLVGYLWAEDERETFDEQGFFRTGDIARRVDGDYLVITGRAKDIIIRSGENIAPKEVEDLLIQHPDIAEIAIVGLPDPRTGERACAAIVPGGATPPDVAALALFLSEHKVARFKIPEQVVLRRSLPRNAAGKIKKHQLRQEILAGTEVEE